MRFFLEAYYNISEIQANHYDKVATDSLFPNIDLSNLYYKTEVGDTGNELFTLVLNTSTKTEIDTFVYINYPSLPIIDDNFYIHQLKLIQH